MAATEPREILIHWLRDAHAMEMSTLDNLERNADRFVNYPDMREKFREHARITRTQADRLESNLKRMGADTSAFKEAVTRLVGQVQPLISGMAADEVVKSAAAALAWEQFQIANYRALVGAAERAGEPQVKADCETAVREEEDLAQWLSNNIPDITKRFLDRRAMGSDAAKH